VDAADLEALHDGGGPALRPSPGGVLVGQPAPEPGVECRSDDEDFCVAHVFRSDVVECNDENVHLTVSLVSVLPVAVIDVVLSVECVPPLKTPIAPVYSRAARVVEIAGERE